MKRKLWKRGVVLLVVAVCLLSQAYILQAYTIDSALGEYAEGKYINKSPAFSVQFPANWVAQQGFPGEIFRIANNNEWSLPVATLTITDKAKDAPALDSDAAAEAYLKALKESAPSSSRHRIESKGVVKLTDGTEAMTLIIKWKYDFSTTLHTAALVAYQGDKVINLSNSTTVGGNTPPEKLLDMLKTLTFK